LASVLKRNLFLRWLVSSIVDKGNLPEKARIACCEPVDSDADEARSVQFG